MKLKDRYKELKRENPERIVLLLSGSFYVTYDMDACLFTYLLSYQVKNDKVGFPVSTLDRVVELLREKKISYLVVREGENIAYEEEDSQFFSVLEKAQKAYHNQLLWQALLDRIQILLEKDFDNYIKIKEFVDEL